MDTNMYYLIYLRKYIKQSYMHYFKLWREGDDNYLSLRLGLWFYVYGVQCHFQQYFSYTVVVSFISGGNQSSRRKPTDLAQVTDTLYHIMFDRESSIELTTIVVIGTDCRGSCKSNYHTSRSWRPRFWTKK